MSRPTVANILSSAVSADGAALDSHSDKRMAIHERISTRVATVGVIGLGYVGLPLARAFSNAGFPVLGFDVDDDKVNQLNRGDSYFKHIPASDIQRMRQQRFEA